MVFHQGADAASGDRRVMRTRPPPGAALCPLGKRIPAEYQTSQLRQTLTQVAQPHSGGVVEKIVCWTSRHPPECAAAQV